jgi:hypothetical protein
MRMIVGIALPLMLAGCGDRPEVAGCESFIKDSLKSPASYRRVSVSIRDHPTNEAELKTLYGQHVFIVGKSPGLRIVSITSDAANSYGTPIRSTEECAFKLNEGKVDETFLESDVQRAESQHALHSLMASGTIPGVSPSQAEPEKKYPCCVL